MNSAYRFFAVSGALMTVLCATLTFAQEDHVTIKRTIGDFYDITISGERNGDFAEIQQVRTAENSIRYDNTTLAGYHPYLLSPNLFDTNSVKLFGFKEGAGGSGILRQHGLFY